MFIMKMSVILLTAPNGTKEDIIARKGQAVRVVESKNVQTPTGTESWANIKLLDSDGDGWTLASTILDEAPDPSIAIDAFARQCWWIYLQYGVNPYYLTAVAQLRSDLMGDQDASGIGPFRFSQAEWNAGRANSRIGLGSYSDSDISDWRKQCILYGLMTTDSQDQLARALGRPPTWVELQLSQLMGPRAASASIANPQATLDKAFAGLKPEDFPTGAVNSDQALDRLSAFVPDARGLKGSEVVAQILNSLKESLGFVQTAIDDVANEFVGATGDDAPGAPDPTKPIQDQDPAQAPLPPADPQAPTGLIHRSFFFTQVRQTLLGGSMQQSQVDGLNAILDEWEAHYPHQDDRWLAYALGTTHHENMQRFQPIRELGLGRGHPYGVPDPTTGQTYYGRGFVQLTWKANYQTMKNFLGVDLVNNPDLALDLSIATKILFMGMTRGLFRKRSNGTPYKLGDYFNKTTEDWINARNIINGRLDRADLIASYAKKYYASISYTK